jgi:hypothetical protein
MAGKFQSLKEFYPYYLTEHQDNTSRSLHYIGTSLFLVIMGYAVISGTWWLIPASIVSAYAFAWIGHFFFERNKPATFTYPFYSLASDFIMLFHFVTGQLPTKMNEAKKKFGYN